MDHTITILGRVAETYEGQPQWEVEQNGQRSYMTLPELLGLLNALPVR
jgi:hypothetical protein